VSAAASTTGTASRGRVIGARALLVLGVLLLFVSILSLYVKREALDQGQFKQTAQQLIASPAIQQQVAATLVDTLYSNVDVAAALKSTLPQNLQGLAGPIAGFSRQLIDRAAPEVLARPRAQQAFVAAASLSQQELVKVLHGQTKLLQTANGNVVLDLTPLVQQLGNRFAFLNKLTDQIPKGSAQITILKSSDLKLAQDVTHWLEEVADYLWIVALACWIGAIWLARGRRRQEVRSLGIGLVVVGVLVIGARWLAGKYLVDHLVQSDSVRPAVSDAWQIISQPLAASGWVALAVGVLTALGAWLVGPGNRATSARVSLAPFLGRAGIAWAAWVVGMALIIWILPIQVFRTTVILIVAGAIGFEVLRRQAATETSAPGGDTGPAAALPAPPPEDAG